MSILAYFRRLTEPDPRAVAMGLMVQRTGHGQYRYSGRPRYMQDWQRRQPDIDDLAVMLAAGVELDARTVTAALARGIQPAGPATDGTRARCWTCGAWFAHIPSDEVRDPRSLQCTTCWLDEPENPGTYDSIDRPTVKVMAAVDIEGE